MTILVASALLLMVGIISFPMQEKIKPDSRLVVRLGFYLGVLIWAGLVAEAIFR